MQTTSSKMDFQKDFVCTSISLSEAARRANQEMGNLLEGLPADVPRRYYLDALSRRVAVELKFELSPEEAARQLEALAKQIRRGVCIPV